MFRLSFRRRNRSANCASEKVASTQASLSSASYSYRVREGLDSRLRQQPVQRCQLRKGAESAASGMFEQPPFAESICNQMGTCVCSTHCDVLHMFRNMAAYMRSVFVKKKKVVPPARLLLDDKKIFLKFSCRTGTAAEEVADTCDADDPGLCLREGFSFRHSQVSEAMFNVS